MKAIFIEVGNRERNRKKKKAYVQKTITTKKS